MCIVTTLDSPVASFGVIHSCYSCFATLLNIMPFDFPTSFTIIALVFVPWFFDKRLFEFVIVIYLLSLCLCKLFIGDVNNLHHEETKP
jgi:hypothetical protein